MYSTSEIADRVSLPLSTFQMLVKEGLFMSSIDSYGRGSRRAWSLRDLELARVIAGLFRAGLPKPLITAVGSFLRECGRLEPVAVDESGRVVLASEFEPSSRFHIVIDPPKFLLPDHEA